MESISDVDDDEEEEDCGVAVLKHTCVLRRSQDFDGNNDSKVLLGMMGLLFLFLFVCRCNDAAGVRTVVVDFDDVGIDPHASTTTIGVVG